MRDKIKRNIRVRTRMAELKQNPVAWRTHLDKMKVRQDKYRFGVSSRKELLNKLGNECFSCNKEAQVIHHIDGNGDPRNKNKNNKIENLMPLCRACHAHLHLLQGDLNLLKC